MHEQSLCCAFVSIRLQHAGCRLDCGRMHTIVCCAIAKEVDCHLVCALIMQGSLQSMEAHSANVVIVANACSARDMQLDFEKQFVRS